MINAFKFGASSWRQAYVLIVFKLLADEPNIREVILFPMTGKAEDLMMSAPNEINDLQLKELGIKLDRKTKIN